MNNVVEFRSPSADDRSLGHNVGVDALFFRWDGDPLAAQKIADALLDCLADPECDRREFLTGFVAELLDAVPAARKQEVAA